MMMIGHGKVEGFDLSLILHKWSEIYLINPNHYSKEYWTKLYPIIYLLCWDEEVRLISRKPSERYYTETNVILKKKASITI